MKFYKITDSVCSDGAITALVEFDPQHEIYQAHFPDNPITPGVGLLSIVKELLETSLQTKLFQHKIKNLKFLRVISPLEFPVVEIKIDYLIEGSTISASVVIDRDKVVFSKFTALYHIKSDLCVLIPTFNNDKTLSKVIEQVKVHCSDIIIVNDGSTDATQQIIHTTKGIKSLSYSKNRGKGYALQRGFELAKELDYHYIITIDSDGQHNPNDIPRFVEAMRQSPHSIIIGSRQMVQKNKAGGSTFANRFANFWFKVQTFQDVPDTQSGYRLYPLSIIKDMSLWTNRYECELEVLVRAAWNGATIASIPIEAYYPPKEERVSHFRPFQDFIRIALLNTCVCLIALLYGYPSLLINKIFRSKNDTASI